MLVKDLKKDTLAQILSELEKKQSVVITIDCAGGDVPPVMDFVTKVQKKKLERNLNIQIIRAGSAAAYLVLMIRCDRTLLPKGTIEVHGGYVPGELNELLLSGLYKKMAKFNDAIKFIKRIRRF